MTDLDRIAARVAAGPGFDVSPGAVSPRPDPELDDLLGELGAGLDDYAARIAREDPWDGAFPGAGELLRQLGR